MKFEQLGLKPAIQQALDKMGFIEPTPIQEQAIPYLLDQRKDLVANAQTGTGKLLLLVFLFWSKSTMNRTKYKL